LSAIKRKLFLRLIEHPKLVFSQILKALKWKGGLAYEDHQDTHLYILPAEILQEIRIELRNTVGKKLSAIDMASPPSRFSGWPPRRVVLKHVVGW
jgi:predicted nucleic acid-binding protein